MQELTDDLKYKARPELIGKTDDAAFNYNEIDTDYTYDAKAIALKNIKISQDIKTGKLDRKFYKGNTMRKAKIQLDLQNSQGKFDIKNGLYIIL